MAKTLKEIPTRSASAETKPLGIAMSLDDLGDLAGDTRTQIVAESLGRVLPASPQAPVVKAPRESVEELPPDHGTTRPVVQKTATQMLSTPIPATMKKRLNRLRLEHSISTAFILETALRDFFGNRSEDEIASDLLARGGRLRRSNP